VAEILWLLASEYVAHPEATLGDTLITEPMGEWPGGIVRVIAFAPDPGAPEIVMQVEGEGEGLGTIGVFWYERVGWLRGEPAPAAALALAESDTKEPSP